MTLVESLRDSMDITLSKDSTSSKMCTLSIVYDHMYIPYVVIVAIVCVNCVITSINGLAV